MIRGLFGRLLVAMCGIATASTLLVSFLQERSLARDLEHAAERRLETAAAAAGRLLDDHVATMGARYEAISGTPQFRATLEVDDGPTLAHYAESLQRREHASWIAFVDPKGRVVAASGIPEARAAGLRADERGVVVYEGRAHAVASIPLATAGRFVAAEAISADRLDAWSELCGARVTFGAPGRTSGAELRRTVLEVGGLELSVASSLDVERAAMANARRGLAMAAALGLGLALAVSLVVSRGLVQPIRALQAAARRIGEGDLMVRVAVDRRDEIGDVAKAFEQMTSDLRATLISVAVAADRVDETALRIGRGSDRLLETTRAQQRDGEAAATTLAEIEAHVEPISRSAAESARRLDAAVDGSTDSFRQLDESGSSLRANATALRGRAEEISSTLQLAAAGASEVARDAEALRPTAETAVESLEEMTAAAREVNAHAEETARLSGSVVESAEVGRGVVRKAVAGVDATRQTIEESERVIDTLSTSVQQIGRILTVIDEVADETSLLALNGSIIAAQAGERGRAFAVVAGQLRALASRVQASTQEIGELVHSIRRESEEAVESIGRGRERAEHGVTLIQRAESSLDRITEAARESGTRMGESEAATARQLEKAASVAADMEAVLEAVRRIHRTTGEQSQAQAAVREAAEALTQVAKEVEVNVERQTRGASQIGTGVEAAQRAVAEITGGLEQQLAASRRVAAVVEGSLEHGRAHDASAADMQTAASDLVREADALRAAIRRFHVAEGDRKAGPA